MNVTTLAQWEAWLEQRRPHAAPHLSRQSGSDQGPSLKNSYTQLPFVKKYSLERHKVLPISWERAWRLAAPESFVLESGRSGRYTYVALKPRSSIRGKGKEAVVVCGGQTYKLEGPPLELVKRWLQPHRSPGVKQAPPFLGGCAGFWGYDVARSLEKLPAAAGDNAGLPDYAFLLVDELWIIDREEQNLYIAIQKNLDGGTRLHELYREAESRAGEMYKMWLDIAAADEDGETVRLRGAYEQAIEGGLLDIDIERLPGIERSFTKEAFIRAVERIQAYIAAGDVFQVNLSTRQTRKLETAPEAVYEALRVVNPSPYMGLLRFGDFQLVSASPELLVQLCGGRLRTRPIAGTRPRSADSEDDARLSRELLLSEKERAEHIMLVDLERNDLGRISAYGTVKVEELMTIERYSHVMHIVSEVTGELAPDKDAFDVIAATFPGGTITGAPKIRTMEIIEQLEPVRRGPYTGSMGWIDSSGNMEFNILIRTLVAQKGTGWVQAGAGIVIDSVPEKEYVESLNKAKALWKAIQLTEETAYDPRHR